MPYRRTENVRQRLAARRDAILTAARALASEGGIAAVQLTEAISPAEVAAITSALLPVMGPIAKPLVARLAKTAVGSEDFYTRLAKQLPSQDDQAMLMRLRAKHRPGTR